MAVTPIVMFQERLDAFWIGHGCAASSRPSSTRLASVLCYMCVRNGSALVEQRAPRLGRPCVLPWNSQASLPGEPLPVHGRFGASISPALEAAASPDEAQCRDMATSLHMHLLL
jgi:hypothetical protein